MLFIKNKKLMVYGFILTVSIALSLFTGVTIGQGATPNFSDYYLDQSTAPYSYMICTDGDGWYWAINGSNGAVCGISTNASYVVNSCITNSEATGAKIVFESGVFEFTNSIQLVSNIQLTGMGQFYGSTQGTILKLALWSNCSLIVAKNNTAENQDIQISDLTLYGNGANQASGDLITLQHCNFVTIADCQLLEAYRSAIYIDTGTAQKFTLRDCFISGVYQGNAIYALTMQDSVFKNNMIQTMRGGAYVNADSGLYLSGSKSVVDGNMIAENNVYGLYIGGSERNIIVNNFIHTNTQIGLYLEGSNKQVISNNIVEDSSMYGAGEYWGCVIRNSDDNIITNNAFNDVQVTHTQKMGIYEFDNSDYNIFVGNQAINNTVAGIVVGGANTKVNLCYNGTTWIP